MLAIRERRPHFIGYQREVLLYRTIFWVKFERRLMEFFILCSTQIGGRIVQLDQSILLDCLKKNGINKHFTTYHNSMIRLVTVRQSILLIWYVPDCRASVSLAGWLIGNVQHFQWYCRLVLDVMKCWCITLQGSNKESRDGSRGVFMISRINSAPVAYRLTKVPNMTSCNENYVTKV